MDKKGDFATDDIPTLEHGLLQLAFLRAETSPLTAGERERLVRLVKSALWGVRVMAPTGPDGASVRHRL